MYVCMYVCLYACMSLYVLLALTTSITRQRKQCQAFTLHLAGPLRCSAAGMVPEARAAWSPYCQEKLTSLWAFLVLCAAGSLTVSHTLSRKRVKLGSSSMSGESGKYNFWASPQKGMCPFQAPGNRQETGKIHKISIFEHHL